MLLESIEDSSGGVDADGVDLLQRKWGKQIGEPDNVVEMGVREKHVQLASREMSRDPERAGAGIENDARLREHQARRVAFLTGVVAAGS